MTPADEWLAEAWDPEDVAWEMRDVESWGVRPAGSPPKPLDRTPAQLTRIRDEISPGGPPPRHSLWITLFDIYTSTQFGYTTAIGDLAKLSGLDHNYIHSLVAWVMSAEHPDIVDLYVDDQPEA